jgi:hypothetical protein
VAVHHAIAATAEASMVNARSISVSLMIVTAAASRTGCGGVTDCPLQVRRVYLIHNAPQVVVKNETPHPIDQIVLHVPYADLFNRYHEPTKSFDIVLLPGERQTLSADPIKGSVDWESLNVFPECRVAADSVRAGEPDSSN